MTKELSPLEAFRRFKRNTKIDNENEYFLSTQYIEDNDIIESTLKNKEQDKELYNKVAKANLEIGQDNCRLNELVNKMFNDLIKLDKFIEVIKGLFDFDFAIRYGDNQPMIKITNKRNGQYWELPETTEICDLLKEILFDGK